MTEDLSGLRQRLLNRLPKRIAAAMGAYEDFAASEPPADAKGFAAWHAAAKAALAHVELLVKLARWAEGKLEAAEVAAGTGIEHLLAQAHAALDSLEHDDEDEDAPERTE